MNKGLKVPANPALALRALNRAHAEETASDDTNTTILQTNKQTDTPTNKQTDQQTRLPTDNPTNIHTNQQDLPALPHTTKAPVKRSVNKVDRRAPEPITIEAPPRRVDGRTLRPRIETSDRTMVTSMRLSVATIEQLDEFCWRHRQRKQDVMQEALTLYFRTIAEEQED